MSLYYPDSDKEKVINSDETFYTDKTTAAGIADLAELQSVLRELRQYDDPIERFHLLHISEIHTPWFSECANDLIALNAIDLSWRLQEMRQSLELRRSWQNV